MPNANDTKPCTAHDFVDSLIESGLQVCAWKGCTATREAPVEPRVGVDVPAGSVVVDARRAA